MRQDIHIDTAAGDIVWKETIHTNVRKVELEEMDAYVLCTIFIPASFDIRRLQTVGAIVKIPYTPIEKPLKIRFARIYGNNNRFIANPNTGDDVFDCVVSRHSGLNVSQLFEVNEDFMFNVVIDGGTAVLYSADDLDFEQIEANIQNRNLLLRCVPGNYYRYPASGVGMILYLNSNISTTDLARVLQAEFSEEKTVVRNAYYDDDTKKLVLDLDFSEANGSVIKSISGVLYTTFIIEISIASYEDVVRYCLDNGEDLAGMTEEEFNNYMSEHAEEIQERLTDVIGATSSSMSSLIPNCSYVKDGVRRNMIDIKYWTYFFGGAA